MSLSASMWTSVSGLLAHGEKMNVVGNNLANVSTVGFRGQRMDFADFVYANTYTSAGNGQIGRGVKVGAIMGNFAQSSFETTTEATDLAISGSGFFKVNKIGKDQGFYTRAGNFRFDNEGYLVDPNGFALQGWMVKNQGGITRASGGLNPDSVSSNDTSDIIGSGTPTDIKLDTWTVPPQQTTKMTFKVNLPKSASDHARSNTNPFASLTEVWNGKQPQSSENTPYIAESSYASSTTLTVYDEAGSKHTISVYYDKVDKDDVEGLGNNTMWEYIVTMDPAEDQRQFWDEAAGELRNVNETEKGGLLATGTITFDAAGRMTNQSCYTWGGSQSPDTHPSSFHEMPDPTNPFNTLQVVSLDPTDLNNWYPAEISSNGYPILVANFSGVLDAQTSGSTRGERYGIELNFGVKVGNFDMPWENTSSLGSLAVTPYAKNGEGRAPEYYEINPDYDPKASWDHPNHYQWKFAGVTYPYPDTPNAAQESALINAINAMYDGITISKEDLGTYDVPTTTTVTEYNNSAQNGNDRVTVTAKTVGNAPGVTTYTIISGSTTITTTQAPTVNNAGDMEYIDATGATKTLGLKDLDQNGTVISGPDKGDIPMFLPPQNVRYNLSTRTFTYADGTAIPQDVLTKLNALGGPTADWKTATGTNNKSIYTLIGEKLASATPVHTEGLVAATPANANHVAEFSKPIVLEASACTSYSSSFTANQAQDGYGYGDLTSYNVDDSGILYGVYSNGVTLPLAQVCLYDFTCQQGLRREGNNLFSQTRASGEAKSGPAGVAGLGTINSYALEQSNVDMSTEFVQMITTQRGFQSNSKAITTTDTMLETVISMKR